MVTPISSIISDVCTNFNITLSVVRVIIFFPKLLIWEV